MKRALYPLAAILALSSNVLAQNVIKFATLAPEGSTWMKVLNELDKDIQEKTHGKLRFRFYAGGVSGDEKDVVRKMRIGQLQGAGFTGVGLGEIAPQVRILDAPLLFKNYAELDKVTAAIEGELSKALETNGYVNLGWTEVGFINLFTATPIHGPADLKSTKMWVWEGDPIAETAFKAAGVNPVPLSVTDVMTSLQTGLINGVYGSPLAVVALQWYSKTPYIHSQALAHSMGAVLVSKKFFDKLPPEQQKILKQASSSHLKRLMDLSRTENAKALETLGKEGLKTTDASPEAVQQYEEIGRKARKELVGRLYPQALLDKVEKILSDSRSASSKKS